MSPMSPISMSPISVAPFALALALAFGSSPQAASASTTWHVPGDGSGVCTPATPSCATIAAALAAAAAGDTVQLGAQTFAESNLRITKPLTLAGAGPESTAITPSGVAIHIEADDVTLRDLTIHHASDAVRLGPEATTIAGFRVENAHFTDNSSDGIEIGITTVTDMVVDDCVFARNANGIRLASRSIVANLEIVDSRFEDNSFMGFYQANDGNTSQLAHLTVHRSVFRNNGNSGIFAEELRESVIENNTFTDNYRAIFFFKNYASSGADFGDIVIRDNDFIDAATSTIIVYVYAAALSAPIDIVENRFALDVTKISFLVSPVDIRLRDLFAHDPVRVHANRIAYHGGSSVHPGAWAVQVRGNGPVEVTGNVIDGGGAVGTVLPTAAVVVRAIDSGFGTLPSGAVVTATCNRIFGFEHGISVMDGVQFVPTTMPAGTQLVVDGNSLAGNSVAGVVHGDGPTEIDASGNWWGCAEGPGGPGCAGVSGLVTTSPALTEPADCVPCLADAECDDGDLCTQDTCDSSGDCRQEARPRDEAACMAPSMAMLALGEGVRPSGRRVVWKASGRGLMGAGFGDPGAATRTALCVYDSSGGEAALALSLPVPAGSAWRSTPGGGFRYKGRADGALGIRAASLKTNRNGLVSLGLRARGAAVPLPPAAAPGQYFARDPAVVVQLVNDAGACWSNEFDAAGTRRNSATSFTASAGR